MVTETVTVTVTVTVADTVTVTVTETDTVMVKSVTEKGYAIGGGVRVGCGGSGGG